MKALYVALVALTIFSCKNTNDEARVYEDAKQVAIDSMKVVMEKQRIIDSMKVEAQKEQERVAKEQAKQRVVVVNQAATPAEKQKKGWSSTAKGAVIGAGVGAATGAIVSKKKGEGAIIGGLAGAGVGAGTGAIIDSEKKKKK